MYRNESHRVVSHPIVSIVSHHPRVYLLDYNPQSPQTLLLITVITAVVFAVLKRATAVIHVTLRTPMA